MDLACMAVTSRTDALSGLMRPENRGVLRIMGDGLGRVAPLDITPKRKETLIPCAPWKRQRNKGAI